MADAKVQIGNSADFLEGTSVNTPAGTNLFREGVVVSDESTALAMDSGVNAMTAVESYEGHMLAQWAYNELVSIQTGHRSMLEPIVPRKADLFDSLDMQIADVIVQGYTEVKRIQKLIDQLEPPDNVYPITQEVVEKPLFFYGT